MRTTVKLALALALVGALAATSGCIVRREAVVESDPYRTRTTTEAVPLGSAAQARVRLSSAAGELDVRGADLGSDIVRGEFTYAPASFKPEVTTDETSSTIEVDIAHPEFDGLSLWKGHYASEWSVEIGNQVPLGMDVTLGAGDAVVDLRGLDLSDLQVNMGAGDLTIDLSGPRPRNLTAWVTAGVGRTEIRLPSDVGVRVRGRSDGVGEWIYDGFTTEGGDLVNDAYGESETNIQITVQRGIGEVELVLVD